MNTAIFVEKKNDTLREFAQVCFVRDDELYSAKIVADSNCVVVENLETSEEQRLTIEDFVIQNYKHANEIKRIMHDLHTFSSMSIDEKIQVIKNNDSFEDFEFEDVAIINDINAQKKQTLSFDAVF